MIGWFLPAQFSSCSTIVSSGTEDRFISDLEQLHWTRVKSTGDFLPCAYQNYRESGLTSQWSYLHIAAQLSDGISVYKCRNHSRLYFYQDVRLPHWNREHQQASLNLHYHICRVRGSEACRVEVESSDFFTWGKSPEVTPFQQKFLTCNIWQDYWVKGEMKSISREATIGKAENVIQSIS